MIRINLLPVRISRRQEAVKRELILGGIGLAFLFAICLVLYLLVAASNNEVRAQNVQLEKDLENLKAIVARVDEIEKFNQELRRKLSVIEKLQENKVGPVHLLDELSSSTPEKLYLRSLQERQKKITLVGSAASNEVISQFLINLEKSVWFDEVYLMSIDQEEVGGFNLKSFQITARMVVPSNNTAGRNQEAASGDPKKGRKASEG